jgi:hypothetical protein
MTTAIHWGNVLVVVSVIKRAPTPTCAPADDVVSTNGPCRASCTACTRGTTVLHTGSCRVVDVLLVWVSRRPKWHWLPLRTAKRAWQRHFLLLMGRVLLLWEIVWLTVVPRIYVRIPTLVAETTLATHVPFANSLVHAN